MTEAVARRTVGTVLFLALVAAASSGCVTSAPRRTTPEIVDNGAALEARTAVVNGRRWDPVLERSYEDGTKEEIFVGFYQGDAQIKDELDFYALAEDEENVARIVDWREKSNRALFATIAAQGLGVAVVAGGIGVGAYGFFADPDNVGTSNYYYAAIGLVIGGSIIVGAAPSTLWSALGPETELDRRLDETPMVIAWPEGAGAAMEFNSARGRVVGTAPSGSVDGSSP